MPSESDKLNRAFKRTRRAVRAGFRSVRSASGQAPAVDSDIETFKRLTPAHFRVLEARYGAENLARYRAVMERKING
ncbi:MAG: hypothetical protein GWN86_17650 [Desulfobacterales bacterium]|nr:hypothetical protein [Desulfobacterales bacterium]